MNAYTNYDSALHAVLFDRQSVKIHLGADAAIKVNAILDILAIGDHPSVAYSKAILAAAELALERCSTFAEPDKPTNTEGPA